MLLLQFQGCLVLHDHSPKQLEHNVNTELAKVSLWAKLNKLTLNPSKSHALLISPTIRNTAPNLELYSIAKSVKHLEVIDHKVLFDDHINY